MMNMYEYVCSTNFCIILFRYIVWFYNRIMISVWIEREFELQLFQSEYTCLVLDADLEYIQRITKIIAPQIRQIMTSLAFWPQPWPRRRKLLRHCACFWHWSPCRACQIAWQIPSPHNVLHYTMYCITQCTALPHNVSRKSNQSDHVSAMPHLHSSTFFGILPCRRSNDVCYNAVYPPTQTSS